MGVARMLRWWWSLLQGVLPDLHGHQLNGLATASWAMMQAGHCQLSRMAACTPGAATVPSSERRWQRLVANARLDVEAVMAAWARWSLAEVGPVTLLLDETPQANHLRAMKLSRWVRGRALPLLWRCYRPEALPTPLEALVLELLAQAADLLPPGAHPTLLTDRGLSWPVVLDFCVAHGWHYLLRAQAATQVRFADGRVCSLADLASRRGQGWCGRAEVFKKAGWRWVHVVAWWAPQADEPWLLITDLPATRQRCRQYRKRMGQEQSFRDEKSHGFHWNDSRIRDPAHASRLLLLMALAMTWLIYLGRSLIRRGLRRRLERADRRTLSLFQLGLRYLHYLMRLPRSPPSGKSVGR